MGKMDGAELVLGTFISELKPFRQGYFETNTGTNPAEALLNNSRMSFLDNFVDKTLNCHRITHFWWKCSKLS